jgi:hypothetical protein
MTTWFCDAYASWQKGAVENANGRLRRDLPRGLDLDALTDAELQLSSVSCWRRPPWLRVSSVATHHGCPLAVIPGFVTRS